MATPTGQRARPIHCWIPGSGPVGRRLAPMANMKTRSTLRMLQARATQRVMNAIEVVVTGRSDNSLYTLLDGGGEWFLVLT